MELNPSLIDGIREQVIDIDKQTVALNGTVSDVMNAGAEAVNNRPANEAGTLTYGEDNHTVSLVDWADLSIVPGETIATTIDRVEQYLTALQDYRELETAAYIASHADKSALSALVAKRAELAEGFGPAIKLVAQFYDGDDFDPETVEPLPAAPATVLDKQAGSGRSGSSQTAKVSGLTFYTVKNGAKSYRSVNTIGTVAFQLFYVSGDEFKAALKDHLNAEPDFSKDQAAITLTMLSTSPSKQAPAIGTSRTVTFGWDIIAADDKAGEASS